MPNPCDILLTAFSMYYHNSVIHLFRPFIKVSFVQNAKPPRQICTDSANMITRLMNQFYEQYGERHSIFLMHHCIVSAGIIHLVNLSSPSPPVTPTVREQAENSIIQCMRFLVAPQAEFPLVERYTGTLVTLAQKWFTVIPPRILQTISEVQGIPQSKIVKSIPKPPQQAPKWNSTPSDDHRFACPQTPASASTTQPSNISFHPASRKHSVTGLVQMAPNSTQTHHMYNNHGHQSHLPSTSASHTPVQTQYAQQVYWTPFPETFDGVPLPLLDHTNGMGSQQMSPANTMSVTGMLGGQFPQLSQDGFMLESEYQGQQQQQQQHQHQQRNNSLVQNGGPNGSWSQWRGDVNGA